MADIPQLEAALVKADAAGDADGARALAGEIRRMREPKGLLQTGYEFATAPIEAIKTIGSGTVGAVAGGIAGIAQGAKNLVAPGMDASDRVSQVEHALTYQPKTDASKMLTGAIAYPFEKLAQGADYVGGNAAEATGSPALGAGVNTLLQSVPQLLARGLKAPVTDLLAKSKAEAAAKASRNAVNDATLAAARADDYRVPPSADGGGMVGNGMEGFGGKIATKQQASIHNEQVTDKIARREAGLAENEPISVEALTKARDRLAAPYREVENLPALPAQRTGTWTSPSGASAIMGKAPPTPKELIHEWKSTNTKITDLWNDYKVNQKVETLDAYRAARKAGEAIEQQIENTAVAAGRADLVPALKQARIDLAKNYNVERATNLGNGHVDANVIGRLYDHGAKMDGGLETIAKFNQGFKEFTQHGVKGAGISKLNIVAAALLGAAGHGAAPGAGGALAGAAALAGPKLSRSFLLSRPMQTPRAYNPNPALSLGDLLVQNPNALAMTPALSDLQR